MAEPRAVELDLADEEGAALVGEVEATRTALRDRARRQLGVAGADGGAPRPLRQVFARYGVSWYPLVALGLLAIVDTFQRFGFSVLTPEISRSLGISKGQIAGLVAAQTIAVALTPLLFAALVQRRARRAVVAVGFGFVWSAFAIGAGFVTSVWGLAAVLIVGGVGQASVHALHQPLLFDTYPPESRVRLVTAYQSFDSAGNVVAPLLVAIASTALALTWRGVFLALGVLSLLACIAALRLRDPGFGRWDEESIRRTVREHAGDEGEATERAAPDVSLGFFEIARRLLMIPTIRRLLVGYAMLGLLLVPFQTFLFFFLDERWNLGPGARGLFFASAAAASVLSLNVFGRRMEPVFRRDPAMAVRRAGVVLAVGVTLICTAGLLPWFVPMILTMGAAQVVLSLLRPAIAPALMGIVPSQMRPHVAALTGIFVGGVGGIFGALFLTGIESRFGIGVAMTSLLLPGLAAAAVIASASRFVRDDMDRMIDAVIEDEEIRVIKQRGGHLPLVACRGVDFHYGPLQVLFGVDFSIDDGEMVALLGVNGAGKSTLLKAISGIGLPTAGSVRFRGTDITYLDAERRVHLGMTQISGGNAVFGDLPVADNLRALGYSVGRDRRRLEEAIESCFDTFPRLAERRDQLACTLSGGEQQMLGLSKALIVRPKLLLIDELSLGLAPTTVGRLLTMVREVNGHGTAVVLVEQSVNVALNLVEHAYFMEKGEIRFDGAARDLLEREDLLRAVFLDGAGEGAPR